MIINRLPNYSYQDESLNTWLTDLEVLEEKARQGKAVQQELREIFLLRTLLHKLPPQLWWSSEV